MKYLKFTMKAWPVIAVATIGLCYLTQAVAKLFGIELPDQANIDLVRQWGLHAFDSLANFGVFVFLCVQVLVIMPVIEELYFRHFVFQRSLKSLGKGTLAYALIPTALILASGICLQAGLFGRQATQAVLSAFPSHPWRCLWIALATIAVAEYAFRVLFCRLAAKTSVYSIMVLSAALFSAAHYLAQPWPDAAFLALFFFGLAQCWLYKKTDRIWCPMLNHALFNLTNLVLLFVVPQTT